MRIFSFRRWFGRRPKLYPVLDSQQAYQKWAADYPPVAHNAFMQIEQDTLLQLLPDVTGKTALDLACGSGRWSQILREHGAAQVVSVDDSLPMLQRGTPPFAIQGDMTATPLPHQRFDVIVCGLAIGHVTTPRMWSVLAEAKRVLCPDGVALLSDVHPVRMWQGGQRTFSADNQTYAIQHTVHSYADYHKAARRIGLQIEDVREVAAVDGEPPVLLALKFRKAMG